MATLKPIHPPTHRHTERYFVARRFFTTRLDPLAYFSNRAKALAFARASVKGASGAVMRNDPVAIVIDLDTLELVAEFRAEASE